MTGTLQNSKVIITLIFGPNSPSASVVPRLLIWGLPEALAKLAATQSQHQERLLEETKRELEEVKLELAQARYEGEAYKKAYHTAENENRDLMEMIEQALNDEIRKFRERSAHGREEGFEQ